MMCATSRPNVVERYDLSFTASRIICAAWARVKLLIVLRTLGPRTDTCQAQRVQPSLALCPCKTPVLAPSTPPGSADGLDGLRARVGGRAWKQPTRTRALRQNFESTSDTALTRSSEQLLAPLALTRARSAARIFAISPDLSSAARPAGTASGAANSARVAAASPRRGQPPAGG